MVPAPSPLCVCRPLPHSCGAGWPVGPSVTQLPSHIFAPIHPQVRLTRDQLHLLVEECTRLQGLSAQRCLQQPQQQDGGGMVEPAAVSRPVSSSSSSGRRAAQPGATAVSAGVQQQRGSSGGSTRPAGAARVGSRIGTAAVRGPAAGGVQAAAVSASLRPPSPAASDARVPSGGVTGVVSRVGSATAAGSARRPGSAVGGGTGSSG